MAVASGKPDPRERDDDGDGLSERAGDCDDTNASVKPGGTISVTVSSVVAGRVVNCNEVERLTVTLTNNSCQSLTVTRFEVTAAVLSGRCNTSRSWWLRPDVGLVAAGSSVKIIEDRQVYPGSGGVGCCWPTGCSGEACGFGHVFTVVTDQGPIDAGIMSHLTVFSACQKVCAGATAELESCPQREP